MSATQYARKIRKELCALRDNELKTIGSPVIGAFLSASFRSRCGSSGLWCSWSFIGPYYMIELLTLMGEKIEPSYLAKPRT